MPSSNLRAAPWVLHFAYEVRPKDRPLRILDVGPGWGKYSILVREYVDPEAQIVGIEIWPPYAEEHRLTALYDPLVIGDIRDQPADWLASFDIVLIVDVLEHLPLEDGLELIEKIPRWIVLATPRDFFENPPDLPEPERHVSHWTLEHLAETGRLDAHDASLYRDPERQIVARLRPRP